MGNLIYGDGVMNSSVRIIKRRKSENLNDLQTDQEGKNPGEVTRDITSTVKGWIVELQRRRRDQERISAAFKRRQ